MLYFLEFNSSALSKVLPSIIAAIVIAAAGKPKGKMYRIIIISNAEIVLCCSILTQEKD
jgi:hypothetical protein